MEQTRGGRVSTLVILSHRSARYILGKSHVVATGNWHIESIVLAQR